MVLRESIIAQARALVGVRFAHQGRDGLYGLDCLGLLLLVAERAGLQFDGLAPMALDVRNYRLRPDADFLRARLERFLVPVELSDVQPADIVLLEIDGAAQHLALLSDYPVNGELGMIHAYAVVRKVVEHRYDDLWCKATRAMFRLPQLLNS